MTASHQSAYMAPHSVLSLFPAGHARASQALAALTQMTSCAYTHSVRFGLLSAGRYTVFHYLTLAQNEVCRCDSRFSFIEMTAEISLIECRCVFWRYDCADPPFTR